MSIRGGWLKEIAQICRAQTGDLKALAEIAGEDPSTFYIGTVMDGADIRGQDLRGMLFTHLDLEKVKKDANTLLDPPTQKSSENIYLGNEEFSGALVYVAADHPDRRSFPKPRFPFSALFTRGKEEDFAKISSNHSGPVILVTRADGSRRRPLPLSGRPFMEVLVCREDQISSLADEAINRHSDFPLILVPVAGRSFPNSAVSLLQAVSEELDLLIRCWQPIFPLAIDQPVSLLLTSTGRRPNRAVTAWTKIFAKLVRVGLEASPGLRLIPAGERPVQTGQRLPEALFLSLDPVVIGSDVRSDAAVLINLNSQTSQSHEFETYESAVRHLLHVLGWRLEYSDINSPGETNISGPSGSYSIETRASGQRRGEHLGVPSLPVDMAFPMTDHLLVSEHVREEGLVWDLVTGGRLTVNCDDLSGLLAENSSIWTIVVNQIRRLRRWKNPNAVTAYLLMLTRSAMLLENFSDVRRFATLRQLVEQPNFEEQYRLTCTLVGSLGDVIRCHISAVPRGLDRSRAFKFKLGIGQTGPFGVDFQGYENNKA